jgi:hypothetical protein
MTEAIGYETDFGVIALTTRELLDLPSENRDFLIAAAFISNDIKFHWSMMVRSPIDGGGTDIGAMQTIRWFWCVRKLSSVIIEARNRLDYFSGKIPLLKKISKSEMPIITKENRKSKYAAVAEEFRNKSAYHYQHGDLSNELSGFDENALHRIFAHNQQGNSISELAEQIFTLPTLRRITQETKFDGFNTWCSECSGSILRFCNVATTQLILQSYPKKSFAPLTLSLLNEAEQISHRWPLFLVT